MLRKWSIKLGSERKLLPIRTGRVTLNVAGCIQIVSFSFFFHGLLWLHEATHYYHFPFRRRSRVICQQLCLVRTLKSARSSCMSCWNMQLWGNATTQHSPGTSTAATSLLSCSPVVGNIPEGILARQETQLLLFHLARKQNSSSVRNPTIPWFCSVQFWKTRWLLWNCRSSTYWETKYSVTILTQILMHFMLDIIKPERF